ncbi:hypothetical protein GCM10022197_08830 [Microlunatus spumicola]|uniref:Magnesium transporter NIPA n=1 Tax=Microlunatus spumicola TaxID=81499 RepID=A0ABP6WS56_9ACTN
MTAPSSLLAVALAAAGALLFGLASVRQHDAVLASASGSPARTTVRERVAAGLRLVRQPAWLLGAGQAGLGGGLHVVALTLAPVTLVQPVGVLAVPVTVLATALARRRRPSRTAVLGAALSVAGVAALTVVLLLPPVRAAALPTWGAVAAGGGSVVGAGLLLLLLLTRSWVPALPGCVGRAVVAAVLFGLVSVLVRTLGEVVGSRAGVPGALVVTAVFAVAVALPVGVGAMQSAYLLGAPQVVVCCLTLVDPLTAVVGGRTLLHDGAALSGTTLAAAACCAALAAVGVVLLSGDRGVQR